MQAFILAGGFATRLWPLTEKRAKPLLPLAGKPLLTWLVEKIPAEIPITVSTNAAFVKDFDYWKVQSGQKQVKIVIEDIGHEDEKLGALGAVAKWIEENRIADDILLLAGDNYVGFSLEAFLKAFRGHPLLATYDVRDGEKAKQLGTVFVDQKTSKVTAFEEKPQHPRSTLVSTGVILLPHDTLQTVTAFSKGHPDNIGRIFEHFLALKREVHSVTFADPWFDIGSFEAYLEATQTLTGEKIQTEEGAEVSSDTVCESSVVLGRGSKVRKSHLRNVVLFEHCTVEDCILERCVIDNHCILKGVDLTGKMLREGTQLLQSVAAGPSVSARPSRDGRPDG